MWGYLCGDLALGMNAHPIRFSSSLARGLPHFTVGSPLWQEPLSIYWGSVPAKRMYFVQSLKGLAGVYWHFLTAKTTRACLGVSPLIE